MSDLLKKTRGRPKKNLTDVEIVSAVNLLKDPYQLSVSIGDFLFDTETDNVAESLLDIKPAKINQKVIISLRRNGMFVTKPVMPLKAKRIFARRLTAEFFAKRLILSMK